MARTVVLTDDLDGSPDASPIRFSVGDEAWEIDLTEANAEKLRKVVERFANKARPIYIRRSARPTPDVDTQAVRAWAAKEGIELSPKGRIPVEVVDRYTAAQAA
jgi:hypothetical protein